MTMKYDRKSLFGYPTFNEHGVQILTETNGLYANMLMNISVHRLMAGQTLSLRDSAQETAVLLLEGTVHFAWEDKAEIAVRPTTWDNAGYCLHIPKNTAVTVTAEQPSLVLVQQTENFRSFTPVFYTPDTIKINTFGTNIPGNTAVR